jgi:hypothetical protein
VPPSGPAPVNHRSPEVRSGLVFRGPEDGPQDGRWSGPAARRIGGFAIGPQHVRQRGSHAQDQDRQAGHDGGDRPRRAGHPGLDHQVVGDLPGHTERERAHCRPLGEAARPVADRLISGQPGAQRVRRFDRGGWSPALFADITGAGFELLTWRKGPAPDVSAGEFTTITCTDDRGREHACDLADTPVALGIHDGPRKGQTVSLRQVTRRVPARGGGTRQIHALTSRTDLPAGEVCWRLTSRWREENYFRYARTHFALDALDSHAATPDDPDRKVPNPAKKTAAGQVRRAEILAATAQAQRDATLAALRNPPPGQPVTITNQMINALDTPVQAACRELDEADRAAAATPSRVPLGTLAPDMMRLEAEVKQITHAIRMTAYNAETALARTLNGRYARASDEAYALIREALTASGDIHPGDSELLIRLDPLTAPRRTRPSPPSVTSSTKPQAATPAPISSSATRSNPTLALHKRSLYVLRTRPGARSSHWPASCWPGPRCSH